jgi:hypothetical protein
MGPAFYVLAILGCGEGETACEQIATAGSSYQSVDDCNQASEGALVRHVGADFPVVVAQCRRADGPASAKLWADEIDRPGPETEANPSIRRASYQPSRRVRT